MNRVAYLSGSSRGPISLSGKLEVLCPFVVIEDQCIRGEVAGSVGVSLLTLEVLL